MPSFPPAAAAATTTTTTTSTTTTVTTSITTTMRRRLLPPPQPVRCTFGLTQNPEPSQKQFTPSMIPRGPAPVAHCRSGASSTRRLCSNSRRRSARCQENYFLTSWDITTQIASSPTSGFLVLLILEARFREIDGTWAGSL